MNYFAYGSNMDPDQLNDRIRICKVIGVAILDGYRLKFNKRSRKDGSGKANIVSDPESHVEGVLFDLTEEQMKQMNDCEQGYRRKTISLKDGSVSAITYIADQGMIDDNLLPTKKYLEKIIRAAEEFRFSEAYQQMLKSTPYC